MASITAKVQSYIDLILVRSMAPKAITRESIVEKINNSKIAIDDKNLMANKTTINKLIMQSIDEWKNKSRESNTVTKLTTVGTTPRVENPYRSLMIPRVSNELFKFVASIDEQEERFSKQPNIAGARLLRNFYPNFRDKVKKNLFKQILLVLNTGNWDLFSLGNIEGMDTDNRHKDNPISPLLNINGNQFHSYFYITFIQRNNSIISYSNPRAKIENNVDFGRFGINFIFSNYYRDINNSLTIYKDVPMIGGVREFYPHTFANRVYASELIKSNNAFNGFCFGNQDTKLRSLTKKFDLYSVTNIVQTLLTHIAPGSSPHIDVSGSKRSEFKTALNHPYCEKFEEELKAFSKENYNRSIDYLINIASLKIIPKKRTAKKKAEA